MTYLTGPLVVLLVLGALALVLRWTYGSARTSLPVPGQPEDFGLLRELAVVETADTANALRALLGDANIRSTTANAPAGGVRVLVFAGDLDRARQLVEPR